MPESEMELGVMSADGRPVVGRKLSAKSARELISGLKETNERLAIRRAMIQNQLDGNPPFSIAQRRATGGDWMSNVNFRENWSICRENINAAWDMLMSVEQFWDLLPKREIVDPEDMGIHWEDVVAQEATKLVLGWNEFPFHVLMVLQDLHHHGIGTLHWRDQYDIRAYSARMANVLLPFNATSWIGDTFRHWVIRDERPPDWFFEKIEDEEAAREAGWNVAEVRKLLVWLYKEENITAEISREQYQSTEWESLRMMQRTGQVVDGFKDARFAEVRFCNVFVVENDGTVSHGLLHETEEAFDWLYWKESRFESVNQVMHFIVYSPGNGMLGSVRGMAWELYPTADISTRMVNAVLDGAIISSGLLLHGGTDETTAGMSSVVRKGFFTLIPPNLQPIQSTFAPPIDQLMGAWRMINAVQNNNSGVYKQRDPTFMEGAPNRTATEVANESANEARTQTSQAALYYTQWEIYMREQLRRILNPRFPSWHPCYERIAEFRKLCKDMGVPDRYLNYDNYRMVKARRALGMGSATDRQRQTSWLLAISPKLDSEGEVNAIRDAIASRMGYHAVDRYKKPFSRNQPPTDHHAVAQLETNDLLEGKQAILSPDQPQTIHIMIHVSGAERAIQQWQESQDPQQAGAIAAGLQNLLVHAAQHVALLAQDPSHVERAQQFGTLISQLGKTVDQISQIARSYADAQRTAADQIRGQLQQNDPRRLAAEQAVEMEKIKMQERVEMAKIDSTSRTREAKMQEMVRIAAEKAVQEARRKDEESARDQARKDQESAAKTRRQT